MLKVDESAVEVSGSKIYIMAELTSLIKALVTNNVLSNEELTMCIEASKKSKEEIEKETLENLLKLILPN